MQRVDAIGWEMLPAVPLAHSCKQDFMERRLGSCHTARKAGQAGHAPAPLASRGTCLVGSYVFWIDAMKSEEVPTADRQEQSKGRETEVS
jgi:hypothetical protein